MYRTSGLVILGVCVLIAVWIMVPPSSVDRGYQFIDGGPTRVAAHCGSPFNVFFFNRYDADVDEPGEFAACDRDARSRAIGAGWWLGIGTLSAIVGLVRGRSPDVKSVEEALIPLPTPEDFRRARTIHSVDSD